MKVVVAPDSFSGSLRASEAAEAIAGGWLAARPHDEVVVVPLSDGGDGLLEVLAGPDDQLQAAEVVGPRGAPVEARWLARADGTAVIEAARACGIDLLAADERDPLATTTWGVGQLLEAARGAGATRILVGAGGSATVDGGAGALCGLGFRLSVADGGGLKVGGGELHRVAAADPGWAADWSGIEVIVLCDVATRLLDAPAVFGPQKGADEAAVEVLEQGLAAWAEVAERDLADRRLRDEPGSGAAGGLGFGLAAGLGARLVDGAARLLDELAFGDALRGADLVITGEGRLDATSLEGKVAGAVQAAAGEHGVPVAAVVGQSGGQRPPALAAVAEATPEGPGEDPAGAVSAAAEDLAARWPGERG